MGHKTREKVKSHILCGKLHLGLTSSPEGFLLLSVHLSTALIQATFLFQAGNALTKALLRRLNESGKIYLIPVTISNKHIIRFVVTSQFTTADDILRDWTIISETAAALLAETRASNDPLPPESVKGAAVGGEAKNTSATKCQNGAAARLEKGEMELWIDKAQKQPGKAGPSPSCNSEPLRYTCFETNNGHECEEEARLNGAAAVPKPALENADLVK